MTARPFSRMTQKIHLDAQTLLEDSWRLAALVVQSGYRPTHMVALWRGGVPIGAAVQEYLRLCGIDVDHGAIRSTHYTGIASRTDAVAFHGLEEFASRCHADDRLLLVDDVYDTGRTLQAMIEALRNFAGEHVPREIRIAVPWFKPHFNQTARVPDYYLHETDAWLMYPHALEGMSDQEIALHRPALAAILRNARRSYLPGNREGMSSAQMQVYERVIQPQGIARRRGGMCRGRHRHG